MRKKIKSAGFFLLICSRTEPDLEKLLARNWLFIKKSGYI